MDRILTKGHHRRWVHMFSYIYFLLVLLALWLSGVRWRASVGKVSLCLTYESPI